MTHVGFTGTRTGMTKEQRVKFAELLTQIKPDTFHHGDCIGADEEAHATAVRFHIMTVIHPPHIDTFRAFRKGDLILPADAHLNRNKRIANTVDILVAAPKQTYEVSRSGTWSTIRYARKAGIEVYIIFPSGEVKKEIRL